MAQVKIQRDKNYRTRESDLSLSLSTTKMVVVHTFAWRFFGCAVAVSISGSLTVVNLNLSASARSLVVAVVADAITHLATPFLSSFYTLTTDNGKQFAKHQEIAKALKLDYYFAHTYYSWKRGANENMNGLIREFFPKKTSFAQITQIQVHRPWTCLIIAQEKR